MLQARRPRRGRVAGRRGYCPRRRQLEEPLKLDGTASWATLQHVDGPDRGGANSCQADVNCSGILPQFYRTCDDGSTSCAHWSCVTNACQIATCN